MGEIPHYWRSLKMAKFENGVIRSGDYAKYFLKSGDSAKYFPGNPRKVVKSEHRKSLVLLEVGNRAEIRPLLAIAHKWRNLKMRSSEVMILENASPEVMNLENHFREILVKS